MDHAQPQVAESLTQGSILEGLFARALKPTGGFAQELKEAGYDPVRLQTVYPTRVWVKTLDIARRRVHPGVPTEEGYRLLGHAFVRGFRETLAGKVVGTMAVLMGPEALLRRLPRFYGVAREGVSLTVAEETPRRWRIHMDDPDSIPSFFAGIVQEALAMTKTKASVQVQVQSPRAYDVLVHW